MSLNQHPKIFFLGATGYLGSQFLVLLNEKLPQFHVIALLRNATTERKVQLEKVYKNISFVQGSLDDGTVIQEQVAKVDIVINCADSDHPASVQSTLAGLETNSKNNPGKPPLYIHVSGIGITSDNARGERRTSVKEWTDVGLDLKQCNPANAHLDLDIPIVEAGTRTENPIRTIIYFPAQIYGIGQGVQKTTPWIRTYLQMGERLGYVGTWGPGANAMNHIHVHDCASGLLLVLQAALEGRADEGAEGLYFSTTEAPRITFREWTQVMGDYLFNKGILKQGGSRPWPVEVTETLGHLGWSLFGGNHFATPQRLYKLGWEPVETRKLSFLDSFPEALEQALQGVGEERKS